MILLAPLAGADAARAASAADGPAPVSLQLSYRTSAQIRLDATAGFPGLKGVPPVQASAATLIQWHADARRYDLHLHTQTVEFDQTSHGGVARDGSLVPEAYTQTRPLRAPESVRVDWPAHTLHLADGTAAEAPAAGTQDRLSFIFELARERVRWPQRFTPGTHHSLSLVGPGGTESWFYDIEPEEVVETGMGPMRSAHYAARRQLGSVQESMDVWLGADLQWLPVRIRMIDRSGTIIDSLLQASEPLDAPR